MTVLAAGVLETAFEHLRRCGGARDECVVYLTGPVDRASLVDGVIHPAHTAGPAGYDVPSSTLADLWAELAQEGRSVRVQVHTHPGTAYHSARDDALALVHTPGFLSLVIPDFATGPVGFENAFLAERDEDGSWVAVEPVSHLRVEK
jgi:proteasome lid subunit RPN8/RPN11